MHEVRSDCVLHCMRTRVHVEITVHRVLHTARVQLELDFLVPHVVMLHNEASRGFPSHAFTIRLLSCDALQPLHNFSRCCNCRLNTLEQLPCCVHTQVERLRLVRPRDTHLLLHVLFEELSSASQRSTVHVRHN